MMNFNPNKPAVTKKYLWATFIPGRRPEFKLHAQENYAKSAFQYRGNGILYMWNSESEEWDEVFRVEKNEYETCEHGGSPVNSKWSTGHAYHRWVGRGRNSKRIAVCTDCYRAPRRNVSVDWGDSE